MADARAGDFALGVGLSSAAEAAELAALVEETLRTAGIARDRIARVGTIDTRATHPALTRLGWPVVAFTPEELAAAAATVLAPERGASGQAAGPPADPVAEPGVPQPDLAAAITAGESPGRTPVAEPAALLAAGPGAVLVVRKRRSARATVAVARAGRPRAAHTPS